MMKFVKIYPYTIGLVSENGNFKRVLQEGKHLLWFNETVIQYNMTQPFITTHTLDILLLNEELKSLLEVVEVGDKEKVLVYQDGNLKQILSSGKHAFWKTIINRTFERYDLNELDVPNHLLQTNTQKLLLSRQIRTLSVESYEKGLLFIDGVFKRQLDAGAYHFWMTNQIPTIQKVDMRVQHLELSGQEILTKDKAALRVNLYAQYQVVDIQKALVEIKQFEKQLYALLQLAVRAYLSTMNFDELLANKESVKAFIMDELQEKAATLGVNLTDVGIRDIILPGEIRDIMNQVLMAEKKAQANTITRREETASTRSLLNTAKLMENNEMLFKLKEMDYVDKIADKINSISLSGGSQVVDQLRQIFIAK